MVDPRLPTDPAQPAYGERGHWLAWLAAEAWDHIWPWSRAGLQRQRMLQAAGFSIALAATVAWVLAATGRLTSGAVIGWWFGWSVYEVLVRLGGKRYVKDGPWWGRTYRVASPMDMICYVSFKNLLIGAVLFLALKSAGRLVA
ncbi:MAG: transcription regulator [Burkholderiales bacterium]|nr:transcription regulator [Burkholderiales bacterium]